jgi:hypothetical protein
LKSSITEVLFATVFNTTERIVFVENGFIILKISNAVVLKTSDVVCRQERWILQNDAGVVDGVGRGASTYLTVISSARHTTRV